MHITLCIPKGNSHVSIFMFISICLLGSMTSEAFSAKSPGFNLSDRFKATCPADISIISQFDPNIINEDGVEDVTWVAVFRSSNNLPSVLVKDDFLNAMRIATTVQTDSTSPVSTEMDDSNISGRIETSVKTNYSESGGGVKVRTPVAIGRIAPSPDFPNTFVIDKMQCSLKKEDTNDSCDGNSEHAEAISICIDELILHHLREGRAFDDGSKSGAIRMKATLHQGRLLEERGFKEVQSLSKDMATHYSNLDDAIFKYSERVVETVSKGPGARDRALKILNYLGKQEKVSSDSLEEKDGNPGDDEEEEFDPWASMKRFN